MSEEEIEYIWAGKILDDDKHLKELRGQFLTNLEESENGEGNIDKLEAVISTCATELERVQLIKKFFRWIPVPSLYFDRFQKSAETSRKLRAKANGAYKAGNFALALRGYNLAIMFSPKGEEELGLAYGNRSALFVQHKEIDLALRDIVRALQNKYPENLKDKLIERQKKCNELISKQQKDEPDALLLRENKLNGKKYCNQHLMRLKSPHPTITNAAEFITIDYSKDKGRRLIVNRDVSAGTVLVVEEPFVHILVNYLLWDTKHCHYCTKRLFASIPCSECTFAMYCNESCREKAVENGHLIEDKLLAYHHCHQTALNDLISTKIILKMGSARLFKLYQEHSKMKEPNHHEYFSPNENTIVGHNDKGIYESGSYLPIYHLISHVQGIPLLEIVSNAFKSLMLTYLLRDSTNFFSSLQSEYTEEFSQEKFEDFVASLLMRHLQNIPFNAVSISELQTESRDIVKPLNSLKLENFKSISYATALFCLVSLANHSCDPNTVVAKKSELQQTALITLKNLKRGEEVFISYKPQFSKQNTKERRTFLKDRYYFVCQCNACVANWNADAHLNYQIPSFKCKECLPLTTKSKSSCTNCDQFRMRIALKLEAHEDKLHEADELLKSGNFLQAIDILVDSLQFFSTHFSSVFSLFQVAQDLYKRALVFLFNSYE